MDKNNGVNMLSALCFLSVLAQVRVSGVVGDGRGATVPGAVVTAKHQERSVSSVTTTAGPDGAYSLTLTAPGRYLLDADAEGYRRPSLMFDLQSRSVRVEGKPQDLRVDLRLLRPGLIRGRLVIANQAKEESPGAGVLVHLYEVRYVRGQLTPVPVADIPPATSSADGSFFFPEVPPENYIFEVKPTKMEVIRPASEEHRPSQGVYRTYWPDISAPLTLSSGGQVDTGRVFVEAGPLQRVVATFEFPSCQGSAVFSLTQRLGRLNLRTAGRPLPCDSAQPLAIENLSPGNYSLTAVVNDEYIDVPLTIPTGEPLGIRQRASTLAYVTGRVQGPDDKPLDWSKTSVQLFPVSGVPSLAEARPVSVDRDGRFRVGVRAGWTYRLKVDGHPANLAVSHILHNGQRLFPSIVAFGDAAAHDTLAVHLSDRLAQVTGTVTRRDRPVEGASVFLAPWPAVMSDQFPIALRTESARDGSFTVKDVPEGTYRAVALLGTAAAIDEASSAAILSLFAGGVDVEVQNGKPMRVPLKLTER